MQNTASVVWDGAASPPWMRSREAAAADGVRGSRIQQLRVCASSQVRTKLPMVHAEALRSLTHTRTRPPHTPHCAVKLYPWRVFRISHYKIALAQTQERLESSEEANQAASERQQSKRDFQAAATAVEEEEEPVW